MELTIIIVNWNGGELLRNCLASIAVAQQHLKIQVIVVDNASRDGSREAAQREFPQFEVLNSGANLGFGRANNLARRLAKSDLVLFLNPDTVLLENSLVPMVDFMREHPELGALGCKMRSLGGEVHELGIQRFPTPWTELLTLMLVSTSTRRFSRRLFPYANPNQSGSVMKLYGGCLLCRKVALDDVGWFDERYFMYAEDVDLCRALLAQGWKLYYLSTAEIIHVAGGASQKAPSDFSILMQSESIAKLMAKHYGFRGAVCYRFAMLVGAALRLTALAFLRALCLFPQTAAKNAFSSAFFKHRMLLLWGLGLRKPVIVS